MKLLINKLVVMKKCTVISFYVALIGSLFFTSFSRNNFKIDIEKEVVVDVCRIDSAMFENDTEQVIDSISDFYKKYPDFFDLYMRRILRIGGRESSYFVDYLRIFLNNPDFRESYDSVKREFGDFTREKRAIERAFSYTKHYLPELSIPKLYTVISGFNESMIITDSSVGISLDKFLGSKSFFYARLAVPNYARKRNEPYLIPSEVVRNWLYSEFENKDSVENLVNTMIYNGKILYLMDAAFPELSDAAKISYTQSEIVWAKKSEKSMWAFLIEKKLLFKGGTKEISKYIEEAPFVSTFGEDSPGRVGAWIGWQIVRSYMNNNPKVTISDLMKNSNHNQILIESEYSPR